MITNLIALNAARFQIVDSTIQQTQELIVNIWKKNTKKNKVLIQTKAKFTQVITLILSKWKNIALLCACFGCLAGRSQRTKRI